MDGGEVPREGCVDCGPEVGDYWRKRGGLGFDGGVTGKRGGEGGGGNHRSWGRCRRLMLEG